MISQTENDALQGKRRATYKGFMSILARCLVFLPMILASCSSDGSSGRALETLRKTALSTVSSKEPFVAPTDKPFLIASYEGASTPMVLLDRQDNHSRYESPDGVQMTLNDVFLARLRGLGQEFEALYLEGSPPDFSAFVDGSLETANLQRIMEYWENQKPKRDRLNCNFSKFEADIVIVQEKCESIYGLSQFTNFYELDGSGSVVRSLQWFHPKAALLEIDHLPKVRDVPS